MKNAFKFGFLALAISLSVAACNSAEKTGESADTTMTADSSTIVTEVDTNVTDSTVKDTSVTTTTTTETPAH